MKKEHAHIAAMVGRVERERRRSFFRRVMPKYLQQLPASVPRSDAKLYFTRLAVPSLGMFCHAALAILFWAFGAPTMALVNVVSVLIFVGALAVVRSGRHYLGTAIAIAEAAVHAPVATYLLGLRAGYLIFFFIVAMCAALTYPNSQRRERTFVLAYCFVTSLVTIWAMHGRMPMTPLTDLQLDMLLYLISASTFFALVAFSYHFVNQTEIAEAKVERELARSEALLLNVLPAPIAARLKVTPGTIADAFDEVTVLFADIVGFTKLSAAAPSAEIVDMLNEVFSAFDRIAAKYGLEKIKTIGDAYMVVGGIPEPTPDHAVRVVAMALEMTAAIQQTRAAKVTDLQIRVGVHSGPVVAGVIGEKKFAYDLWGDTVNTASRMESHGVAGRIQISDATAKLLGGRFDLEDRGDIEVKGKGKLHTWLVVGRATRREAA